MIKEIAGNLLQADADALVNTVNTVGVMGKGIALQFKKAYPAMFVDYTSAVKAGDIELGKVHVWPTEHMTGPRYIINFPTKGHWRARSRLHDIEAGLEDLVRVVRDLQIRSIALPPLGCGNGGLDWRDVRPLIVQTFAQEEDVDVLVFPPKGAPTASQMPTATTRPKMTAGRAALVEILRRYTQQAMTPPSLIESQKLMYFLQAAGEPLRLNFAANRYGPYADNLRHVLHMVEGHFIHGYGDASAPVQEAEPLTVLPGATEEAVAALAERADTRSRIDRVLDLAAGFESAYGLELLATVHWLATQADHQQVSEDYLVGQVEGWSPRKSRMFTANHVQSALAALRDRGWLAGQAVPV